MRLCFCLILLLLSASTAIAAKPQITVMFDQPEAYTDFTVANGGREDGRPLLMAELDRYLRERGRLWLHDDQFLTITFTDIDMAGRLVPLPLRNNVGGVKLGIAGSAREQRVVQPPWPPRLTFHYQLVDENGQLLREGSASINETSFLKLAPRTQYHQRDSLWYEKAILDSWLRSLNPEHANSALTLEQDR
ncbi:MAG: hypothetical protein Tsb002_23340 [Wenzhouxiangellaceae bacterium]